MTTKKHKYKYMFTGFYGMKNFGDDLFSSISSHAAVKYWHEKDIVVIGPKVDDNNVVKYSIPNEKMQDIYSSHNVIGKGYRLWNSFSNALKSDTVVYSGGSLFSTSNSSVRKYVDDFSNSKLFALGVSIGPFLNSADELSIKRKLSKFKYISVRDEASFDILSSFNLESKITQSVDLAGLIPDIYSFEKEIDDIIRVGFSPCNNVRDESEMRKFCEDFFISILRLSKINKVEVLLFNLNTHPVIGDQYLNDGLYTRLTHAGISCRLISHTTLGINGTLSIINKLNVMVSARLHGAISAYALKVPYILYEYHKKCEQFNALVGNDEKLNLNNSSMYQCIQHAVFNSTKSKLSVEQYNLASRLNFSEAPIYEL